MVLRTIFRGAGGFAKGYGFWWVLIEILDRHGTGDTVTTTWSELALICHERPYMLRRLFERLKAAGKVYEIELPSGQVECDRSATGVRPECDRNATGVRLERVWDASGKQPKCESVTYGIKKFRERQSKIKSNIPSILRQSSLKTPIEGEGEGEVQQIGAAKPPNAAKAPPAKLNGSFHGFMDWALKDLYGMDPGNPDPLKREAVRTAYSRYGRAAKDILALAEGDVETAKRGTLAIGRWIQSSGRIWNLETVAKWFGDWKQNPGGFDAKTR